MKLAFSCIPAPVLRTFDVSLQYQILLAATNLWGSTETISNLKAEGLSCKRSEHNGGSEAASGKFFETMPFRMSQTPFRENLRPSYYKYVGEKKSFLIQVDCIGILDANDNIYKRISFKSITSGYQKVLSFQTKDALSLEEILHQECHVMRFFRLKLAGFSLTLVASSGKRFDHKICISHGINHTVI